MGILSLKMFATFALTALLASASLLRVRADVTPSDPGPGVVYKAGGTCHIEWVGDKSSPTAWKNMAIQLMTGDNLNMIHLTTVATGLDGTADGTFDHTCPSVSPNSAIYFYQFTAPNAPVKQWTTRFTIASAAGATTPPTNNTQPGGDQIPWGTGALSDPSTAVPPPSFTASSSAPGSTISASSLPSASVPLGSLTSSVVLATISPSSSVALSTAVPTASGFTTVLSSSAGAATPSVSASANSTGNAQNNAAGSVIVNSRIWQAVMALCASTVAFVVLL
ncbi:hypothetical protein C0993_010270 [Termitomyces sp. T159_Od127]|nr:hypothetical protein C0993_010270 [Termitomyces sp. T159_Od127]